MTYKTRQEVLRDAADWMDVCEKAGVAATVKVDDNVCCISYCAFWGDASRYEFPLALLEGKEVWVGSELWCCISNHKFTVKGLCNNGSGFEYATVYDGRMCTSTDSVSWNPPKPSTVMVEMLTEDAEYYASEKELPLHKIEAMIARRTISCKKALETQK